MQNRDVMIWKAIAFGAAMVYLYKASKASGGTLSQNPYGIKLNPERVATFASMFAPKDYRHHARQLGQVLLEKYL